MLKIVVQKDVEVQVNCKNATIMRALALVQRIGGIAISCVTDTVNFRIGSLCRASSASEMSIYSHFVCAS